MAMSEEVYEERVQKFLDRLNSRFAGKTIDSIVFGERRNNLTGRGGERNIRIWIKDGPWLEIYIGGCLDDDEDTRLLVDGIDTSDYISETT